MKYTEALDARDALCKNLYGKLFDWLVNKVTATMKPVQPYTTAIGVLDIFGFESFDNNSFEQLCINYANERLHQQFISYFFKHEMEEYREEGIDIDVAFTDNQSTVDLIEQRPASVLSILVEQCTMRQVVSRQQVDSNGIEAGVYLLLDACDDTNDNRDRTINSLKNSIRLLARIPASNPLDLHATASSFVTLPERFITIPEGFWRRIRIRLASILGTS